MLTLPENSRIRSVTSGICGKMRSDDELRQPRLRVERTERAQQAERDRGDRHQRQRGLERQRRRLLRALVARPLRRMRSDSR